MCTATSHYSHTVHYYQLPLYVCQSSLNPDELKAAVWPNLRPRSSQFTTKVMQCWNLISYCCRNDKWLAIWSSLFNAHGTDWLCGISGPLCSTGKDFIRLHHLSVEKWYTIQIYFHVFPENMKIYLYCVPFLISGKTIRDIMKILLCDTARSTTGSHNATQPRFMGIDNPSPLMWQLLALHILWLPASRCHGN